MARNGKKKTQKQKSLPFIQPDAAGIDIGATEIYVAVPEERDNRSVRKFATFTEELHRFADWLMGAIYAELIDKLRAEGAIRPGKVDRSALVHTCWDLGSPVNTCVWFFQVAAGEIRVIDLDMDLDLTPVERLSRMLAKGYLYGSHFLPHDAMATQKSGRTFLMELKETGLANVKAVPRTQDVWIGINKLRGILPRFSFRVPECERGLEALCAYHTVRETSTGIARDEPCHDASSHACDALRVLAEAEAAHMLSSAGFDTEYSPAASHGSDRISGR